MAKTKNRNRTRGNISTTNQRLRSDFNSYNFTFPRLREVEDRRLYHPKQELAPAKDLFGSPRHLLSVPRRRVPTARKELSHKVPSSLRDPFNTVPSRVSFMHPEKIMICVRRKIRKEVLHALGHSGKGGQRKPRFTEYSSIDC